MSGKVTFLRGRRVHQADPSPVPTRQLQTHREAHFLGGLQPPRGVRPPSDMGSAQVTPSGGCSEAALRPFSSSAG